MPDTFKPLFNRHLLKSRMGDFEHGLTDAQLQLARNWASTASDPDFQYEKEKPHQGEFLLQLFGELLGYTPYIGHADDYNLKAESASKETKGGKTPDGCLGFFGKDTDTTRAVIELKAPAADLDLKQQGHGGLTPVEQGFGYVPKFDGCRWVIVSNFVTIRLYNSARGQAYCHEWQTAHLADEETLREFVFLLQKDRLISKSSSASPTGKLATDTHTQEEKITKDFYAFYKDVRLRLFRQLVADNPAPEGAEPSNHEVWLLEQSQKILDRVLFICFCEDKGLLPHGVIRKAIEAADGSGGFVQTSRWQQMTGLFHAIDKGNPPLGINGYNGGLFAEDAELDKLTVADKTLDDCLRLSEYDFETDLNVNILGHIFEQSISDLENLRAEIQGESIDRTKSKRKKEGVFYTPEYITRFIVENTIGSYLQERFQELEEKIAPAEVRGKNKQQEAYVQLWTEYRDVLRKIKVLDPACGSGAFLVAAFDYLHSEYQNANDELAALRGGQASLFDLDKQILQENLFGVDINHESVEITKLSLWLKTANKGKPLNNLDGNIKCGNSLIDSDSDNQNEMAKLAYSSLPDEVQSRAFEWRKQFPQIFAEGGFDCVIGNPPYVRMEILKPIKPYLESEYSIASDRADIYCYFYEKGVRCLKPGGKLGYISSNTFFKTGSGEPLRKFLLENVQLEKIVDFGDLQPFEDATTYPAIVIFKRARVTSGGSCSYYKVQSLDDTNIAPQMLTLSSDVLQSKLSDNVWYFEDSNISVLRNQISSQPYQLRDLFSSPGMGIKTGLTKAFCIDDDVQNHLAEKDPKSASLLRPFLDGKNLKTWHIEWQKYWLIYTPKNRINIDDYPAIKEHLIPYKERLEKRATKQEWFELQQAQEAYVSAFESPKIIYSDISNRPNFAYDEDGFFCSNTGYFIPNGTPFLLALLNSRLLWFIYTGLAPAIRGGYYRFFSQYVEQLPIPEVADADKEVLANLAMQATAIAKERYALHEQVRSRIITDLGTEDGKLNKKLTAWYDLPAKSFRAEVKKAFKQDIPLKERNEWESALAEWQADHQKLTAKLIDVETEINDRVYKLYGLSDADIQLLEDHMKKTMIFYPLGEV